MHVVDLRGEQLLLDDVVLLAWMFTDATVLSVLDELERPGLQALRQVAGGEPRTSSSVRAQWSVGRAPPPAS
jgi:hypothetical protein